MDEAFEQKALQQKAANGRFLKRLGRKPPKDLDEQFHQLHEQVFQTTDCLSCANCCKTTSPIFLDKDIDRIAKHLRIRPAQFIDQYLQLDQEQDYVLRTAPCPFLGADNYCSIYDVRPRACKEYPHTNRKKMHQILRLTHRNTVICPAVLSIVQQLRKVYPQ